MASLAGFESVISLERCEVDTTPYRRFFSPTYKAGLARGND
ncbi:hypothetical protein SAMN05660841_03352 [Sphingobacterium nematocida]|uniref:Uncharacterized protein n=1 Tax=Sphingobacterium nematocida TaxID=1513896 RepID=A0A1T5FLD7_9SPHI|nr:hypothetical protein SAMN05660841_03352 [Sphingobacterium nematocida]